LTQIKEYSEKHVDRSDGGRRLRGVFISLLNDTCSSGFNSV